MQTYKSSNFRSRCYDSNKYKSWHFERTEKKKTKVDSCSAHRNRRNHTNKTNHTNRRNRYFCFRFGKTNREQTHTQKNKKQCQRGKYVLNFVSMVNTILLFTKVNWNTFLFIARTNQIPLDEWTDKFDLLWDGKCAHFVCGFVMCNFHHLDHLCIHKN